MKQHLKTAVSAVVFLAIGAVLTVWLSYTVRPLDDTNVRKRVTGFYAVEKNTLDIVTIGSSSVYRYVDVPYLYSEFGYTSYTLGTPGQSYHAYRNLIAEVEKTQKPQLYIIDSRRYIKAEPNKIINTKRLMELAGNMKYSKNRTQMVKKMSVNIDEPLPYYLDIITYHSAWPQIRTENFLYFRNEKKDALMGWQNMTAIKEVDIEDMSDVHQERAMVAGAEIQLRDLCEYCQTEGIPLLFIGTAYLMTEEQKQVSNTFRNIVESYGMGYLECNDYLEEMGLDFETDFYNEYHTNCIGARKHTLFLGKYIEEHYQITKNHSERTKEVWDETAARDELNYTKCYEKMKEKAKGMGKKMGIAINGDSSENGTF